MQLPNCQRQVVILHWDIKPLTSVVLENPVVFECPTVFGTPVAFERG